jgi:hypothetical protein
VTNIYLTPGQTPNTNIQLTVPGVAPGGVVDVPIGWSGRFTASHYTYLIGLRQSQANDVQVIAAVVDTPIDTLARYTPSSYAVSRRLFQAQATDVPIVVPTADDPASSLARFTGSRYAVNRILRQNQADDIPPFVAPAETPIHFLGHHTPRSFQALALLRQNADENVPPIVGAVFETNPHFLGRFTQVPHNMAAFLQTIHFQNNDGLFNYGPPPTPFPTMWNPGTEWQRIDRYWGNR